MNVTATVPTDRNREIVPLVNCAVSGHGFLPSDNGPPLDSTPLTRCSHGQASQDGQAREGVKLFHQHSFILASRHARQSSNLTSSSPPRPLPRFDSTRSHLAGGGTRWALGNERNHADGNTRDRRADFPTKPWTLPGPSCLPTAGGAGPTGDEGNRAEAPNAEGPGLRSGRPESFEVSTGNDTCRDLRR